MNQRSNILRFPAAQGLPSFDYNAETGEIVVTLKVGHSLRNISEVLTLLQGIVGDLQRAAECAERSIANDRRREAHRQRCVELARAYQVLRLSGVKHRAAIRALFVDPAFSDLHFSTADIADTVKRYGGLR